MAFEILVYLIIFFGVSGMALGAYGVAAPRLQSLFSRLLSLHELVRRWRGDDDELEDEFYEADEGLVSRFEPRLHPSLLRPREDLPEPVHGSFPRVPPSPQAAHTPPNQAALRETGDVTLEPDNPPPVAAGSLDSQPERADAAREEAEAQEGQQEQTDEDEILAFFKDEASKSRAPATIREALPLVSAQDLLVEARDLIRLLRSG